MYDQTDNQRYRSYNPHSWIEGLPRNHNHNLWRTTGQRGYHQMQCLELGDSPSLTRVCLHLKRKWLILDDKSVFANGTQHAHATEPIHRRVLGGDPVRAQSEAIVVVQIRAHLVALARDHPAVRPTEQARRGIRALLTAPCRAR